MADEEHARQLCMDDVSPRPGPDPELARDVADLFVQEAKYYARVDDARRRLERHELFSAVVCFQLIAGAYNAVISVPMMHAFLSKGIKEDNLNVKMEPYLFKGLYRRCNERLDYRITFDEFVRHILKIQTKSVATPLTSQR